MFLNPQSPNDKLTDLSRQEEEPHTRKKGKEGKERPPRAAPQPKPGYLRQRQGDALNK